MIKVYCKNCKYCVAGFMHHLCNHPNNIYRESSYFDENLHRNMCKDFNQNNNCTNFTPTIEYRIKKRFNLI